MHSTSFVATVASCLMGCVLQGPCGVDFFGCREDDRARRMEDITPSMFAGHSMLCSYESRARKGEARQSLTGIANAGVCRRKSRWLCRLLLARPRDRAFRILGGVR